MEIWNRSFRHHLCRRRRYGNKFEKLWNYPFVDYTGSGFSSYHEIGGANIINPARIIYVDERELRCRLVSRTNA